MSLTIPAYYKALYGALSGSPYNYNGIKLSEFCTAVATGVVNTSTGLTGQIGSPSNTGSSSGTGIIFSGSNVAGLIQSKATTLFGQAGSELSNFCTAIGSVTQSQFALAALSSDANESATFSSFTGAEATMASAIQSAAPSFTGNQWANFCTAIAHGICHEIGLNGSGSLSGALGPGVGTGVVSIS